MPRLSTPLVAVSLASMLLMIAAPAFADNTTRAEKFTVERPTLLSLGFEWRISGDDNRNANVAVSYRKKGDSDWRKGLPMLRLDGEVVNGGRPVKGGTFYYDYTAPNMFAGSVLNLEPDTDYECRFVLNDPDGVSGQTQETITVHTRKVPAPASGGHVYHVYPFGYNGPMEQPAFTGLMSAYYRGTGDGDHANALPPRVEPGDTILVHAGLYRGERYVYGGIDPKVPAYGVNFDGTYYLTASGTPDRPIAIKAAGDGEVIFDGADNYNLFNLEAGNYNYFEGITVRNTDVAFLLGIKNIVGASGFSLVRSRLENIGRGVQDDWADSKDFYIANNVFIGRHSFDKLQTWYKPDFWGKYPGYPATVTSEYAVKLYGQGHVVANNYVAAMHDGFDIATYGTPSEDPDKIPVSIDFYNNDFYGMADNCIELDGGAHNVRAFRNRCFNTAGGAFSFQPVFGGPAYLFENIVYQATTGGPLKTTDTPAGMLVYQNTFIGQGGIAPVSNAHFRNNLFVGDNWKEPVFDLSTFTNYSSSDYNGWRLNPEAPYAFGWTSPEFGGPAVYKAASLTKRHYATLAEYQHGTNQDRHSVMVDYDIFQNVSAPDPNDPQRLYAPENFDFGLKANSSAVDKGDVLPNINDHFTGNAPDLGALEFGKPVPHYGPIVWPTQTSESSTRAQTGPPH
ncbi:MAG: hypothetical protein K2W78_00265 [Xanthobacteraceae bacterium]|nr:hypothetical protein [Xanthobacteraceae bacterium]